MPTVYVFGETRMTRAPDGTIRSHDSGVAGRAWTRGLDGVPGLGLAMRIDTAPEGEVGDHIVDVEKVAPLPYYVGAKGMLTSLPALVRAIDSAVAQADAVVARLPGLIGLLAIHSAHRRGVPLAVEMVGDIREVLDAGSGGSVGRRLAPLAAAVTRDAMRKAGAARYVTRSTLQERYPVRDGVPTVGFSSVRLDPQWVVDPDTVTAATSAPCLVAMGSQEQLYKGHDTLIKAMPSVLAEFPTTSLVLVGKGRMQGQLKDLAAEIGVADSVTFSGYLGDREAVRDLLDGATIFCMPSRTEGLPRALVEAMARGRMALGSRAGGIPELISSECLVDANDAPAWSAAIVNALRDDAFRVREGRRNIQEAATYTQAALQEQTVRWRELVTALIGGRR